MDPNLHEFTGVGARGVIDIAAIWIERGVQRIQTIVTGVGVVVVYRVDRPPRLKILRELDLQRKGAGGEQGRCHDEDEQQTQQFFLHFFSSKISFLLANRLGKAYKHCGGLGAGGRTLGFEARGAAAQDARADCPFDALGGPGADARGVGKVRQLAGG